MFYLHSGNGVLNLTSTAGGAQDARIVGGSQLISERMASELGRRVVLSLPVRGIAQTRGHVAVSTDLGVWRARHAIVAIAPALAGRIDYSPALPALRDQLTQRLPQGSAIKFEAVYPRRSGAAKGSTATATPMPDRSASRTTTHRRTVRRGCCSGSSPDRRPGGWAGSRDRRAAPRC
jgi:monoamine oxidase